MAKDSNVIPFPYEGQYVVAALCVNCTHRWVSVVLHNMNLFKLTCPRCGAQESFPSLFPREMVKSFLDNNDETS